MLNRILLFLKDDKAATAVEYGLVLALIAAVCIAALTTLGTSVQGVFNTSATAVSGATGGGGS